MKEIIKKIIASREKLNIFISEILKLNGKIYFVGGVCRDLFFYKNFNENEILNIDLDIEVHNIKYIILKDIFLQIFQNDIYENEQFGILKANKFNLSISIPRSDFIGRYPKVKFLENVSIKEALFRRDLTINSIAIEILNNDIKVYDPFNGIIDLENKIARATKIERFADDPLRILRLIRFSCIYNLEIEENTLEKSLSANIKIKDIYKKIDPELKKIVEKNGDIERAKYLINKLIKL